MDGSRPNSGSIHPGNIYKYCRNIFTFHSIQLKIMRFFIAVFRLEPKTRIIGSIEPKIAVAQMVDSILFSQVGQRQLVKVPCPTPILGADGKPMRKNDCPLFNVKHARADFQFGTQSAITHEFVKRYIISGAKRATPLQLAVLFALAETTSWAECFIVVDDANKNPIMISDKHAQAAIGTFGNRSATRSIMEIQNEVQASYGAVHKALDFWLKELVVKEIEVYKKQSIIDEHQKAGRKPEFKRYEFDPLLVWRGYYWLRNAYAEVHASGIEVI